MHWTTAKLLALDEAERFLAQGWARHLEVAVAEKIRTLRREIPTPLVAAYDRLKAEHKAPVVGVVQTKCDGCLAPLSPTALAQLSAEHETSQCEQCGRFIYLTVGHDLGPTDRSPHPAGGQRAA